MAGVEQQQAAMAELQRLSTEMTRVNALNVQMMAELAELRATAKAHEEKLKARKPDSMTKNKSFLSLPSYSGKADEYEEWKFKMGRFLSETEGFA